MGWPGCREHNPAGCWSYGRPPTGSGVWRSAERASSKTAIEMTALGSQVPLGAFNCNQVVWRAGAPHVVLRSSLLRPGQHFPHINSATLTLGALLQSCGVRDTPLPQTPLHTYIHTYTHTHTRARARVSVPLSCRGLIFVTTPV